MTEALLQFGVPPLRKRAASRPAARSAPLRRNMPRYVAPKLQWKILPRAASRLHPALGAAATLAELAWYYLDDPVAPAPHYAEPEVLPAQFMPAVSSRGRITTVDMRLDRLPPAFTARRPQSVNVPRQWVRTVTQEAIERGPEHKLSLGSVLFQGSLEVRIRHSALAGTVKRRRDGKSQDHAMYVAFLSFVNRTYGPLSEAIDLYEAIAWNTYAGGKPVAGGNLEGPITVDWPGVVSSLFMNEVVDRSVGTSRRFEKRLMLGEGYKGPQMPTTILRHLGRM